MKELLFIDLPRWPGGHNALCCVDISTLPQNLLSVPPLAILSLVSGEFWRLKGYKDMWNLEFQVGEEQQSRHGPEQPTCAVDRCWWFDWDVTPAFYTLCRLWRSWVG